MVRARARRARGALSLKLHIAAVGRLKSGPEKQLADDYSSRIEPLGRICGIAGPAIREVAESRRSSLPERLAEEGGGLLAGLPAKAYPVVLDEQGKLLTSTGLAGLLKHHLDAGTGDLGFLVGGPDGHAPFVRERAGFLLSLGAMTWPHRLVRVMLAEQIYRAVTILVNHPYHRP